MSTISEGLSRDELVALLKEVQEARLSGVKRVRFRERDTIYKSDDDMAKAIASIERMIAKIDGCKPRPRVRLATFRSGF